MLLNPGTFFISSLRKLIHFTVYKRIYTWASSIACPSVRPFIMESLNYVLLYFVLCFHCGKIFLLSSLAFFVLCFILLDNERIFITLNHLLRLTMCNYMQYLGFISISFKISEIIIYT